MKSESSHSDGYEKSDVNIPVIIGISLGTIVVLIVIILFLADFFKLQKESVVYDSFLSQDSKELLALRKNEHEKLTSYKVLDIEQGIYQIPVQRAMQLLAEENSNSHKK